LTNRLGNVSRIIMVNNSGCEPTVCGCKGV
jgi:hypothetical protein